MYLIVCDIKSRAVLFDPVCIPKTLKVPDHIETGDGAGVLGGSSLSVIEVCGDGDNRVGDVLAQVVLGNLSHLGEHGGGDLLGGELLLAVATGGHADVRLSFLLIGLEWEVLDVALHGAVTPVPSDEPLGVEDGVLRVGRELVLGRVTDQSLALLGERHVRRSYPIALVIWDDVNAAIPHYSNTEKSDITYIIIMLYRFKERFSADRL